MDQELHDAAVDFEECGDEIRRFWEQPRHSPDDMERWRQLEDRAQKSSKRLRDATVRIFAKRA